MGCNCDLHLPQNVRVSDVAEACGILLGIKQERVKLSGGSWSVKVTGISYKVIDHIPAMVNILLSGCEIGDELRSFYYHYETSGEYFLMLARSTALNIAMFKRLADFFGGVVDANDCDEEERDYQVKFKSRKVNSPEDGKEWEEFQERMLKLKPLTKAEIKRCEKLAAYKEGE